MRTIDVLDFQGDSWQLLAPPLRWNRPQDELWMLIVKRTNRSGEIRNFLEIPVPCFTDWWYQMTGE